MATEQLLQEIKFHFNHTSCQFRGKHTVGGIVFYKHTFLVCCSMTEQEQYIRMPKTIYPKKSVSVRTTCTSMRYLVLKSLYFFSMKEQESSTNMPWTIYPKKNAKRSIRTTPSMRKNLVPGPL